MQDSARYGGIKAVNAGSTEPEVLANSSRSCESSWYSPGERVQRVEILLARCRVAEPGEETWNTRSRPPDWLLSDREHSEIESRDRKKAAVPRSWESPLRRR